MSIDLSITANNFTLVNESLKRYCHSYIAIERDKNNRMLGCKVTFDRNDRASLTEINEFVRICLQQNDNQDDETLKSIRLIEAGLDTVLTKIIEGKEQGCCNRLWFWLKRGDSIVAETRGIISRITDLTKSLLLQNAEDDNSLEEDMKWNFEPPSLSFIDEDQQQEIDSYRVTLSEIDAKTFLEIERASKAEFNAIANFSQFLTDENGFERVPIIGPNIDGKNRYGNILPYKNNYIGKDNFEGYVNASKVSMHGVNYIATQGPLHNTIEDFFKMVVDFDATIVTLANKYENGRLRCHDYWIMMVPLFVDGWKMTLIGDKELYSFNNQAVQKRTFSLSKDQEPDITITQFHYVNWPDLGIPDSNVFDRLLEEVEKHHPNTNPRPIVTHCSAGIGRTGTFVATHSARNEIRLRLNEGMDKDNISINFVEDIVTMRSQRMGLVQTEEQLSAVKKAIFRYQQAL